MDACRTADMTPAAPSASTARWPARPAPRPGVGSLTAPAEAGQDFPHMRRMIANAEVLTDHRRDPGQRPVIGAIPCPQRPLAQQGQAENWRAAADSEYPALTCPIARRRRCSSCYALRLRRCHLVTSLEFSSPQWAIATSTLAAPTWQDLRYRPQLTGRRSERSPPVPSWCTSHKRKAPGGRPHTK